MTGAGSDAPVVAVTGGGGGIGGAIAEELGRQGWFVVTVDPLVSLDGAERLAEPEETTAARIVAAGGAARATSVSVTDRGGVRELFEGLVDERGRLDAVVNVAGITRPTSFASGTEADWLEVLAVHLDGYRNVLDAALPLMVAAGHGHVLGVTSGSGWRPADTGAYGCAKRAVAALTWQLGRQAPPGVTVNAVSPIAATRMVAAALRRARPAGAGSTASATGGLSLDAMPTAEQIGPLGAHLVSERFGWCSGAVVFAGGSEVAVIEPPRLLEAIRTDDVHPLGPLLERVSVDALAPAEERQAAGGAGNPRFGSYRSEPMTDDLRSSVARTCIVVSDRPDLARAIAASLATRSVACRTVGPDAGPTSFAAASASLSTVWEDGVPPDAVVVALAGTSAGSATEEGEAWRRVLAEHAGIVAAIHADAAWARAATDLASATGRSIRLVTLTDATTAGGRSRAQAAAHHARAARRATEERVAAFGVSVETAADDDLPAAAELAAHLVCNEAASSLSGAELVAGPGWVGLRSHPRPRGSIVLGDAAVPSWLDAALQELLGYDEMPAVRAATGSST